MMDNKDQIQPSLSIDKEDYFRRLSEVDSSNLVKIRHLFKQTMKESGLGGALFAVGGTLTKSFPRKDIDVIVVLEPDTHDPDPKTFSSHYRFALADFSVFRKIITEMISKDPQFKIRETIEPAIDEEFDSEEILKHEGSLTMETGGIPIEFIRYPGRGVSTFPTRAGGPYVRIAEYKNF